MKKVILLSALLAMLCGCAGSGTGGGTLTIEETNDGGAPNITTYENLKSGDEVYNGRESIIAVKSVSKNRVALSVDGCFVEPNEDGTINLRKDPLKKIILKSGQAIKIVSQTMDAGVMLNITYE